MYLYLSSYKLGNKTEYLKKWIEKERNNKILLIPNARDAREQSEEEQKIINSDKRMLEDIGFEVTILDLKEFFTRCADLKKYITENDYRAFYVIGGNVFTLRQAMKLSGFDKYIQENYKRDNIMYAGYSAGICVLSPSLNGFDIVEPAINPYNSDEMLYNGLNLINYEIVPHYKSNHKSSLLIEKVIAFFNYNKIKYKAIKDGEVIISKAMEMNESKYSLYRYSRDNDYER